MTNRKKLIGVYEPGGIVGKKPSEMTREERREWAEAMADLLYNDIVAVIDAEGE